MYEFAFAVDTGGGVNVRTETAIAVEAEGTSKETSFSINGVETFSQNTTASLFVRNTSGTSDVTLNDYTISGLGK